MMVQYVLKLAMLPKDNWSNTDWGGIAIGAVFLLAVLILVALIGFSLSLAVGLDSARAESQYTGEVVDVEVDRGLIFRTSQVHMKTDAESSNSEVFCVAPWNENKQLPEFKQAASNQQTVTVTYSRPRFVPITDCKAGTSIVRGVSVHE